MEMEYFKKQVCDEIDAHQQELNELCLEIHSNPELGFNEVKAVEWLTRYLEKNGFTIETGIYELTTAFRASYGEGKPVIAILAEYDALPDLGHACGHNIIATIAIGTGIASKLTVDKFGGSIQVIGTPAEELYGGKVTMASKGAFSDIDIAMMVHPATLDTAMSKSLACHTLYIEFFGKAAHASSEPEAGINALEAMLQSFTAINSLRQHIKTTARIHGVITNGGQAANIVPSYCAGTFIVRAEDEFYLEELKQKVINCFVAGSLGTGAKLEYKWDDIYYAPMCNNVTLARLFTENMKALGRNMLLSDTVSSVASTDMGNVSQLVPAIHPYVKIAEKDVMIHSPEFALAAASGEGMKGMIDSAKALSMTIVDLLATPEAVNKAKDEFVGTTK